MKQIKKYILAILLLLATTVAFAQLNGPGEPGGDPEVGGDPPLGASLGGGFLFLLTAGIIYGGRKVFYLMHEDKQKTDQ